MKSLLKFLLTLAAALVLMMLFRATALTVCTVEGNGLEPVLADGDRILVNRWSYGLRVGGRGSLFSYGRLCRQAVTVGDIVALESTETGQTLVCRCCAVPGDTVCTAGTQVVVPSTEACADADYYWLEPLGTQASETSHPFFATEQQIIGRACVVLYSHDPSQPLWRGWRQKRFMLPL